MKPVHTKHRRSKPWGTGAAAVAAVAIVAGGFYAFSNHGLTRQSNKPGVTTASHDKHPIPSMKFPNLSDIKSMFVLAGPTLDTWTTENPKNVSRQVLKWLTSSIPYKGSVPKSTNKLIPQANIGPAQLKMRTSQGDITVFPVYYLTQTNSNEVQTRYVQNVIQYQTGNQTVYLISPQLFDWLKNNQWTNEFTELSTPITDHQPSKGLSATMTPKELANYAQSHGGPLPSAGTNVQRINPSKSRVFFGAPSVHTVNNKTVPSTGFKVVDLWSGTIQGKTFQLEIDKATNGQTFVVDTWSGSDGSAIELNKQPWITNFTGSFVILASPDPAQGNPMYAINLANATIVPNSTVAAEYIRLMSGIGMGGYPGQIEGLPKICDIFPNGQLKLDGIPLSELISTGRRS